MSHTLRRRGLSRGPRAVTRDALILLLAASVAAPVSALAPERFPYIQTTILSPFLATEGRQDRAYVFKEKDRAIEFSSLDIGATVDGNKGWETLSDNLPFLADVSDTTIFSATLAENGQLIAYVGDCESDSGASIWTYTPSSNDDKKKPEWKQHKTTNPDDDLAYPGPTFLGASISFSSEIEPSVSDPVLYSFGGMCAKSSNEVTSWQYIGRYTNQMRKATLTDGSEYRLASVPSKGPVREAGFTFTRLLPSLSHRADAVSQRTGFVLLGGHTQEAFVNMSTAAVWSLPEESWSFVNINPPKPVAGELRAAAASRRAEDVSVDSRSGHTTVLSEDGSTLVLLGGWVGNVQRAAHPQLVLIKMGASYDEWQWVIPDEQPSGSGIYGHGAALLPGNVMMVHGGYEITPAPWAKSRRQAPMEDPRFLNLTTMEWSSSYSNPGDPDSPDGFTRPADGGGSGSGTGTGDIPKPDAEQAKDGKAKRLGLGIGLGLGIPLVVAAVCLFLFYRRSRRRRRTMRDDAIRALAQDRALFPESEMAERDYDGSGAYDAFAWDARSWYTGGHDPYDNGVRSLGCETLRGSRPSLQLPRKPVGPLSRALPRGLHQPPAAGGGPPTSNIHPIYEADEDDEQQRLEARALANPSPEGDSSGNEPHTPTSLAYSDPFQNPPLAAAPPVLYPSGRSSATPSPEGRKMDPEVQDWMSDVDVAEGLLARINRRQSGRGSPARGSNRSLTMTEDDARTASNLSESNRSVISVTRSASGKSRIRSSGLSSGFGLLSSGSDGRQGSSNSSSPSYNTAKTSFAMLQAEGPGLLYGSESEEQHHSHQGHWYSRAAEDEDEHEDEVPGSPSKMKPRRGWLGSLRRVFSGSGGPPPGVTDENPPRASLERVSTDYEPRTLGLTSIGGGSLLRRKQGKQAWEQEKDGPLGRLGRSNGDHAEAEPRYSGETADWDIEKAVEERLVQVMFTVPKERLRVVNAEVDKEEEVVIDGEERELMSNGEGSSAMQHNDLAWGSREKYDSVPDSEDPFYDSPGKEMKRSSSVQQEPEHMITPLRIPDRARRTPEVPERSMRREGTPGAGTPGRDHNTPTKMYGTPGREYGTPKKEHTSLLSSTPKLERPRTKVLDMVESIEGRSREGSPRR